MNGLSALIKQCGETEVVKRLIMFVLLVSCVDWNPRVQHWTSLFSHWFKFILLYLFLKCASQGCNGSNHHIRHRTVMTKYDVLSHMLFCVVPGEVNVSSPTRAFIFFFF